MLTRCVTRNRARNDRPFLTEFLDKLSSCKLFVYVSDGRNRCSDMIDMIRYVPDMQISIGSARYS
jgi:hypothetical protein